MERSLFGEVHRGSAFDRCGCAHSGGGGGKEAKRDAPGMLVRPPIVLLGAIAIGLALQAFWRVTFVPGGLSAIIGAPLVGLSLILLALSVRKFRAAGTGIRAHQPTTLIVTSGPYRFSRNPIYLSFALLQIGLAIWVNTAWLLATLVPLLAIIRYGVISREEAYLERKFGEEYMRYKRSARRWL
ncbi:MAG TPA: isoprenylcysteine carboxylmethyltransferase family protein [Methylomirabilota bacterium]|nr:isoprenylcysteine carboxylmethyltransferase family protein [Methylomirabilota bacterium]